jgi:proteasome lid subunit RPN8/RPN11
VLLVTDFQLVTQECSFVTVAFDDVAVADFFDRQVDLGLKPHQFARIWIHTHPGNSPNPSTTDEQTFARVFGHADWALMFILAAGGDTYARLQFHVGPGSPIELDVEVDYSMTFDGSDHEAWHAEYKANVTAVNDLWLPSENGRLADLSSKDKAGDKEPAGALITEDWRDPFYAEEYWYGR